MRELLALLLVGGVAFSGCLVQAQEAEHAYDVVATFEPSMLPNFGKDAGPYYRFLQIHQHVMPSPEQEREWNRPGGGGRVVCFRLDGVTPAGLVDAGGDPVLAEEGSADKVMMDSAAARYCEPTIDPGRGRLFHNRTAFQQLDPLAVAVFDACSGDIMPIHQDEPGFLADAPAHRFRVEFLSNDTVLVDGQWYVEPGRTLKVEYMAAGPKAGAGDDRPVKFVLDYAGFWLVANVGEPSPGEEVLPPRPTEGNGPEAWIPRAPARVQDVLIPLQTGAPDASERLHALRLTSLDGKITDVRITMAGNETVEWFVAGGNETHLRMLGRVDDAAHGLGGVGRARLDATLARFDLSLVGKGVAEIRWEPELALKSSMPVPWSETWVQAATTCSEGCTWVWTSTPTEGAAWRKVPDPDPVKDDDAMTLVITMGEAAAPGLQSVYHWP